MPANGSPSHIECPSCTGCSLHENLRHADIGAGGRHLDGSAYNLGDHFTPSDAPVRGSRLALASLGLFLVPVLLAMIGAILNASDPNGQLLGAATGLLVGMLNAIVMARFAEPSPLKYR